ncbi:MAG: aldo/keto reductase, partial [Nitrospinota bacterium]|nr:aldo/keto reductase [Nitrospinota bacterium]
IQKQGKIGHIGVSNYSVAQMQECLKIGPLVSLQPEYSLLQRSIEKEAVPFCLIHDIGIIAYSPLASGVLTGKYDRDTKFKDWRSKGIIGQFTGEAFVKNIEKVEQFKAIAESEGKTCGQMAVNWVTHQPGVASALVGVKNDRQVEENLKSVGWKMEAPVQDQINQIFAVEV